ncbi:MAG: hypothetical protein DMD78_28915 [Candidatus Rokuibacteriota bacterium]|nr:MAG: hypothetical protein DMD78_28915 [Candidatus Rokubacteria bacterium]
MRVVRYALVAATVAVTGAFFFSRWAINADAVGRHDMGAALLFSYLVVLTVYGSLGLAAAALVLVIAGLVRRRRHVLDVVALGVSLLPAAYLLALDYRLLVSR